MGPEGGGKKEKPKKRPYVKAHKTITSSSWSDLVWEKECEMKMKPCADRAREGGKRAGKRTKQTSVKPHNNVFIHGCVLPHHQHLAPLCMCEHMFI